MSIESLKKEGDKLLTPLALQRSPNCEACGMLANVGHHFIEKSRSNLLRFDIMNIISLCQSCHTKIHNRFGNSITGSRDVYDLIVEARGNKWHKKIRSLEHKSIKADIIFWQKQVDNLKQCIQQ